MRPWHKAFATKLSVLSMLTLAACSTMMASSGSKPVQNEACLEFKPILWSKSDMVLTPDNQTMVQIKAHNAVWKRLCGS